MSEMTKETNLEHYREELKELIEEARQTSDNITITTTGKLGLCNDTDCHDCIGKTIYQCREKISVEILNFLMQEYKPVPTITAKEKKILELLQYEWIARDKNGHLCAHAEKPCKNHEWDTWNNLAHDLYILYAPNVQMPCFSIKLDFIKWEDNEPWQVSDLLKLQVKE